MKKVHVRVLILQDGIILHSENVYHEIPEVAIHENAAQLYRFFADDMSNVVGYCKVYSDRGIEHWMRKPEDATFKRTTESVRVLGRI